MHLLPLKVMPARNAFRYHMRLGLCDAHFRVAILRRLRFAAWLVAHAQVCSLYEVLPSLGDGAWGKMPAEASGDRDSHGPNPWHVSIVVSVSESVPT